MTIILNYTQSIKSYIKSIESSNIKVTCPCCGRRLWKHGRYQRTVHTKRKSYVITILRWRCPDCRKTYSLVPCFIKPWARFANHIWEYLGRYLLEGVPKSELPELLTTSQTSILSLKTIYRWSSQLYARFLIWLKEQRTRLAHDYQDGEGILPLYRLGMNTGEELQVLLTYFLDGEMPSRGNVFATINTYLPTPVLW